MLSHIKNPIDENIRELLMDTFLKRYAARIKTEGILLSNKKAFFVSADFYRQGNLQEYNYGATSSVGAKFGKDAVGQIVTRHST